MRKWISLILLFCLIFPFAGCSKSEPDKDEEGNRLYITGEEMELEGTGREGFFVLNEDGTFSPVINEFHGYQGITTESTPDRFLWFTNNVSNISDLIPTVTEAEPLVMVYNSDASIPSSFTLERYVFRGYTIGCHIFRKSDNSIYFSTEDTISTSYAGNAMSKVEGETEFRISTVNGSENLPYENVDNNLRMLLGLEKEQSTES